jgi:hypothetical protein
MDIVKQMLNFFFANFEIRRLLALFELVNILNLLAIDVSQSKKVIKVNFLIHLEIDIVLLLDICDKMGIVHNFSLVSLRLDLLSNHLLTFYKALFDFIK